MPADTSTTDLRDALVNPSIVAPSQVRNGIGATRSGLLRVTRQVAEWQQLLAVAEGAEDDPHYSQKFERLRQAFVAAQRDQTKVEECLARLGKTLRELHEIGVDFVQHVNAGDPAGDP